MNIVSWLLRYRTGIGLALVVAASTALATRWALLVPIFQSPDENAHLDYALCIYHKGGLYNARELPLGEQNFYDQHPYTLYLRAKAQHEKLAFNPDARISTDYGTKEFFKELDRGVPSLEGYEVRELPSLMRIYPFGYYTLAAAWIGMLRMFTDSLTVTFFGTRMLSVLLLGLNLVVMYHILRELRYPASRSLAITACVGCFPLVSFVCSYIQPDNLGFFLASLSWYLALVVRRSKGKPAMVALLGLSLGGLLVTKTHFFLCVTAPIAALLLVECLAHAEFRRGLLWKAALLAAPPLVTGSIHLYTTWGITNYFGPPTQDAGSIAYIVQGLKKALLDYYTGMTHKSFWGLFGWTDTPLVIGSRSFNDLVWGLIQAVGLAVIVLTLMRLEQVSSRLMKLAHRGRRLLALRMALSNPVVNSYFAFTVLMIGLYVWLDNRFAAQGRNWIPFVLPFFLTAISYAPKALRLPVAQRYCSAGILAGFAVFVGLASYYGPKTIYNRYYSPLHGQAVVAAPAEANLVASHQVVWRGENCAATGDDPYLAYGLPPQFVHAVEIRFVLDQCPAPLNMFQVFWRNSPANEFSESERTARFLVRPSGAEQVITVWVNDTIDCLRIDPAGSTCQFQVRELRLVQPRHVELARR